MQDAALVRMREPGEDLPRDVHRALIDDWKRDPAWPFFLLESTYEGEHNASQQQIRRQAYWSVLCGGNGHVFGNHPIWLLWDGWQGR